MLTFPYNSLCAVLSTATLDTCSISALLAGSLPGLGFSCLITPRRTLRAFAFLLPALCCFDLGANFAYLGFPTPVFLLLVHYDGLFVCLLTGDSGWLPQRFLGVIIFVWYPSNAPLCHSLTCPLRIGHFSAASFLVTMFLHPLMLPASTFCPALPLGPFPLPISPSFSVCCCSLLVHLGHLIFFCLLSPFSLVAPSPCSRLSPSLPPFCLSASSPHLLVTPFSP